MTVVINMHKTYVMSWLWRCCHVSLMHTPSSKVGGEGLASNIISYLEHS